MPVPGSRRFSEVCLAALVLAMFAGCQADYGADIRNDTSTPVFAQLMILPHGKGGSAVMGASRRLGPGDRAPLGPVRASDRAGSVFLSVDSLPNASRPATMDLAPGTSFLDVTEENGTLRLFQKP